MWKDIILHTISSTSSMIFNYFQTKQMCEDNTNDLMVMSLINFVMITMVVCMIALKSPIHVVDNRIDLK
jgi:hypothetical protein